MSVVVWDGKTLAADKQATVGGMKRTVTKIHRIGDLVVGLTGELDTGMEMLEWIRRGRDPKDYPSRQSSVSTFCATVIIDAGKILVYENAPYPYVCEDPVFAAGSGRDFAIAAVFCGLDARKAVQVATQFDNCCGMGIDAIDVLEPLP